MEKIQKDNLLKTIDEQAKKIETYKKKLKDVVEAYKDLSKEKLALEASVNALSYGKQPTDASLLKDAQETNTVNKKDNENALSAADEEARVSDKTDEESVQDISPGDEQQRLNVLMTSLKTLTQQKNKLEQSWVAERKQSKMEMEMKEQEVENLLKQLQQTEDDMSQLRGRLRHQQQEHSQQQEGLSEMVKELQSLLNQQKLHKQQLLSQVEEMKTALEKEHKCSVEEASAHLVREKRLEGQLEAVRQELKAAEASVAADASQLQSLKLQVAQLQAREALLDRQEGMRAGEWEERQRQMDRQHEERVAELEVKVVQLTQVLAEAEVNRNQLQHNIRKLQDRNAKLDLEVSTLTSLARPPDLEGMLGQLQGEELLQKAAFVMTKLKQKKLHTGLLNELLEEDMHVGCRRQLQEALEDFERYKLRAQSVLKSKSKESSSEQELLKVRTQLSETRDKVMMLQKKLEGKEEEVRSKEEDLCGIIRNLKAQHLSEVESVAAEGRQKVACVEGEMRKQRERTVSMLAEKEQEVAEMRMRLASQQGSKVVAYSDNEVGASSVLGDEASMTLEQLLSSHAKEQSRSSDQLLHYAQEKAMMEVQLSSLRKEKFRLESELKDHRLECSTKEKLLEQEVEVLKEVVRKGDRNARRDSANLEYLKNIVLQYMISSSSSSKQQIAKAISTILQFSPSERQMLHSRKGWPLTTGAHET